MIHYKQNSFGGYDVIFRFWGSVLTYAWMYASFSALVCFLLIYCNVLNNDIRGAGIMHHPTPFNFYFQIAALVLAFHANQAYRRFWEARTQLQSMAAYWGDAAAHVLAFDRCKGTPQELLCPEFIQEAEDAPRRTEDNKTFVRRVAWQAKMVHLFSLLHAVSVSYLLNSKKDNVEIEVLGGVSRAEHHELAITNDHSYLVSYWVTESLTSEHVIVPAAPGLAVPAALLSRTFQLANNGVAAYNQACKIEDTPFPFPYIQLLHVMNWTVIFITPVVMACWVSGITLACSFTWLAVGAFHSLFAAAGLMESPFGTRPNDLPLIQLNSEFIKRLVAIVTPNVAKYLDQAGHAHMIESMTRTAAAPPSSGEAPDDSTSPSTSPERKHSTIQVAGKTIHLTPHMGVSCSQLPSSSVLHEFEAMPSPSVTMSDVSAHAPFEDLPDAVLYGGRSVCTISSSASSCYSATQSRVPSALLRSWPFPPSGANLSVPPRLYCSATGSSVYGTSVTSQSDVEIAPLTTPLVLDSTLPRAPQRPKDSFSGTATSLDAYPHVLQRVGVDARGKRRLAESTSEGSCVHQASTEVHGLKLPTALTKLMQKRGKGS